MLSSPRSSKSWRPTTIVSFWAGNQMSRSRILVTWLKCNLSSKFLSVCLQPVCLPACLSDCTVSLSVSVSPPLSLSLSLCEAVVACSSHSSTFYMLCVESRLGLFLNIFLLLCWFSKVEKCGELYEVSLDLNKLPKSLNNFLYKYCVEVDGKFEWEKLYHQQGDKNRDHNVRNMPRYTNQALFKGKRQPYMKREGGNGR